MRTDRQIEARGDEAGSGPVPPRWWLAGVVVVLATACTSGRYASSSSPGDDRLTHRVLGYSIARPSWEGAPDWRSIDVEGADLAYGNVDGTAVSLSSDCPHSRATAVALARHVTIGTARTALLAAGPFEIAGAQGWTQTFDTVEDGVVLHIKAITVVADPCVYDWLLVVGERGTFESIEPRFDAWIETFHPPPSAPGDAVQEAPR